MIAFRIKGEVDLAQEPDHVLLWFAAKAVNDKERELADSKRKWKAKIIPAAQSEYVYAESSPPKRFAPMDKSDDDSDARYLQKLLNIRYRVVALEESGYAVKAYSGTHVITTTANDSLTEAIAIATTIVAALVGGMYQKL